MDQDQTEALTAAVQRAIETRQPLRAHGHGSKAFCGNPAAGQALDITGHSGVLSYEPGDLVITARAGTWPASCDASASWPRSTASAWRRRFMPATATCTR